jgi:hypothetical protein
METNMFRLPVPTKLEDQMSERLVNVASMVAEEHQKIVIHVHMMCICDYFSQSQAIICIAGQSSHQTQIGHQLFRRSIYLKKLTWLLSATDRVPYITSDHGSEHMCPCPGDGNSDMLCHMRPAFGGFLSGFEI